MRQGQVAIVIPLHCFSYQSSSFFPKVLILFTLFFITLIHSYYLNNAEQQQTCLSQNQNILFVNITVHQKRLTYQIHPYITFIEQCAMHIYLLFSQIIFPIIKLPMKKFNTQFVNQTPSYSPLTDFDHYIPEKHPTSLQFVSFEKGKENLNNNDPLLSSNRPHRGHYKANQQLRQSVHDLLNEMEHALDPKDQRKPIDKYYERRLQRESIEKSPKSNDKRLLSTMEIGSYQKRNEDLITDRTQKTNAQFQGFGIKPALIKIRSLPQLQISITQQILMLRQQKITLMHRKNSIIDQKNEIFRQVAKLKRICQKQVNTRNQSHKQRSQDTEGIKRKSSLQDQNQYLKNKIEQQNQLCIPDLKQEDLKKTKQNQQKLLFQIQKYQRLCNCLQQQLQKRQMKFANRFQTFLPSQKHIKSKQQNKNEKNNKLWNNEQLLQLRLKNRKLMNEANTMIAQKRSYHIEPNINILEQIVQMNKMIKQGFFQEVRCYKIQIPKLKTQNMKMKRALHNF